MRRSRMDMTIVAALFIVTAIGGCSSSGSTVSVGGSPTSRAEVATSGSEIPASTTSVSAVEQDARNGSSSLAGTWTAVSPLRSFLCVGAPIEDADSSATTVAPTQPYPCSVRWQTVNELEISGDGAITVVIDPLDRTDGADRVTTTCNGSVDASTSQVVFADDACTSEAGPVTTELGTTGYEADADCLVVLSGDDGTEVDRHYARGTATCDPDAEPADEFEAIGNAVTSGD